MCVFTLPVRHVGRTQIFARSLPDGRQVLIYGMNIEIDQALAMVLPLPVPPGPGDDAVEFVDLRRYPELFRDLERAFSMPSAGGTSPFARAQPLRPKLDVHRVGDFEASFVPTRGDFDRLDERFRLDAEVWNALPGYADYGFAVFKLAPKRHLLRGIRRQTIHPMALSFPRREPDVLFFPTVHVHDGAVHDEADFDHQLYCQPDEVTEATLGWRRSPDAAGRFVDAERCSALVDADALVYEHEIVGKRPNRDVTLRRPAIDPAILRHRGQRYLLDLNATAAHYFHPKGGARRWQEVARRHMPAVASGLVAALDELTEQKARAWHLGRYEDELPEYVMSWMGQPDGGGGHVLVGPGTGLPFEGNFTPPTGSGRVAFSMRDDHRLEPQRVFLAFDRLPTSDRMVEIQQSLDTTLAAVSIGSAG